ncbi:MAG: 50S ribosomal protein L13 [Chloroflexi bacterium]|nr:50S ribosomal protein L13 [Chloroflexota bacterium]
MQLYRETTHTKSADRVYQWHVIDADGERLGRLASRIAVVLMGKDKPDYSRHQLSGDFVIVVNAVKVAFSGNKRAQKIYYRHTGYIGHLRERTLDEMMDKFPTRVIEQAVKGMLPRNRLGRQMLRRLKVYAEAEHPHEAQVRAGLGKAKEEPAAPTRARRQPAAKAAAPVEAPEAEPQVAEAPAEAPAAEAVAPARRRTTRRAAPKAPKAKAAPKKTAAATRRKAPAAKDAVDSPAPRRRTRRAAASEGPKPEGE